MVLLLQSMFAVTKPSILSQIMNLPNPNPYMTINTPFHHLKMKLKI